MAGIVRSLSDAPSGDPVKALEERVVEFRRVRHQLDQAIAATELELRNLRRSLGQTKEPAHELSAAVESSESLDHDLGAETHTVKSLVTGSDFGEAHLRYLDAGARLIKDAYRLRELDRRRDEAHDDAFFGGDVLAFITPTSVTKQAGRESVSSFYALWPQSSGGREAYVLDLLRYVFTRLDNFIRRPELDEPILEALGEAFEKGEVSRSVHRLAAQAMKRDLLDDPLWYLQLTLSAMLRSDNPRTPVLRRCVSLLYRGFDDWYKPQYKNFIEGRGLEIRGDVSFDDVTNIIGALSEGLALRHQSSGTQPDEQSNLFGVALLALIDSLVVDPLDPQLDDDLSIDERVERKFEQIRRLRASSVTGKNTAAQPLRGEKLPTHGAPAPATEPLIPHLVELLSRLAQRSKKTA